jgi:hypothetical protein
MMYILKLLRKAYIPFFLTFFLISSSGNAQKILIPMDLSQTDHLKAYGLTYWVLTKGDPVDWLSELSLWIFYDGL